MQVTAYEQAILPGQVDELVQLASSMLDSKGIHILMDLIMTHAMDLEDYMASFVSQDYGYDDPELVFDSLKENPVTLVWDHAQRAFAMQEGDRLLTVVIPATEDQQQVQIRLVNFEAHRGYDVQTNDYRPYPTKIAVDLWAADQRVLAIDWEASYDMVDDTYELADVAVAFYLEPYIYTAQITTEKNPQDNSLATIQIDANIFGPSACDTEIHIFGQDVVNDLTQDIEDIFTFIFRHNSTKIDIQLKNMDELRDDMSSHRDLSPDATSSPNTQNYLGRARLYYADIHRANIMPANGSR